MRCRRRAREQLVLLRGCERFPRPLLAVESQPLERAKAPQEPALAVLIADCKQRVEERGHPRPGRTRDDALSEEFQRLELVRVEKFGCEVTLRRVGVRGRNLLLIGEVMLHRVPFGDEREREASADGPNERLQHRAATEPVARSSQLGWRVVRLAHETRV